MGIALGDAHAGKGVRVYAIGDVHGCLKELKKMMKLIKADLDENPIINHRIIFLGDYTDRGPKSAQVVGYLADLVLENRNVTCLFGNHDQKLVKAFNPLKPTDFRQFLKYGGVETLRSYGFSNRDLRDLSEQEFTPKVARKLAEKIKAAVPKHHQKFLAAAPKSTTQGDYFFCHAGVDPSLPLGSQRDHDLMWMREPFLSHTGLYSKVIIHGHTRQERVDIRSNRINVDTSCWQGVALTAAVLEKRKHRFLTVKAARAYWTQSKG